MGRFDEYPRLKKYQERLKAESYIPVCDAQAARLRGQYHKIAGINGSEHVAAAGETFALIALLIEARVPVDILDLYLDSHDRELMQDTANAEDNS
ncbi:hypothetical protein [Kozakia baliensis]|nr:hypothetical protein [Kozakia baliensis]GBR32888.1 hypothetical protein AA0488_2634 [Kozakia baliensis NRIC 0488]GEL65727.1 hypothetical protein KBA01_30130 [Kozakia baliensis]